MLPMSQPSVRLRAIITANSATGFLVRDVSKGTKLSIQYRSGDWKSTHRAWNDNPDEEGHPKYNYLAIALPRVGGKRGEVLAVVPAGTSKQPFVFQAEEDYPEICLRINDEEDSLAYNQGTTEWDIEVRQLPR